ncbi:NIPA-like protein 3 [Aphanomyces cochlioides]|nr:NIPA-like protein 3 [Aphanomyces cochlioides]
MKSDFLGATIAISAAIGSNLGVNVQKRSHDKEDTKPKHLRRPYTVRPMWWLGMFLVVFGSLGDLFALGFAPQTLVASLGGGSTIVANVLFAHYWLKQPLYFTDVVGVILVSSGVVVLALSSAEEGKYSVAQLFELMRAPAFIVYVICTSIFVTFLLIRVRRSTSPALRVVDVTEEVRKKELADLEKSVQEAEANTPTDSDATKSQTSEQASPFPSPVVDMSEEKGIIAEEESPSSTKSTAKILVSQKHSLVIDKHLPLYWAAISGTLGAQSVLLAKCVMELINMSFSGENQFIYPGTWILLAGMVACLLSQTHALNKATMSGDTMSTFPVFQAFWIGMSNISGIVYFQQAHSFSATQWIMFPSALMLVMVGIILIAKHEKMGNNVKYSVAMPLQLLQLSSPRQTDIVAQSFLFKELTPQQEQGLVEIPLTDDPAVPTPETAEV